MATTHPVLDLFDPEIQRLRNEAETLAYGETGGVSTDGQIAPLFLRGLDRPRISMLMNDVLTRHEIWKLGSTMVAVADRLGTDHGTISRALHWGELSPMMERFIMACPTKPHDLNDVLAAMNDFQHRSAFLEVADYLAGRMQRSVWPKQTFLRDLHAELLFDILENRSRWLMARNHAKVFAVQQMACTVCSDPARDCVPFWYTAGRQREIQRLISRLNVDARFAFRYSCLLQDRWEKAIVLTWAECEGRGWLY